MIKKWDRGGPEELQKGNKPSKISEKRKKEDVFPLLQIVLRNVLDLERELQGTIESI